MAQVNGASTQSPTSSAPINRPSASASTLPPASTNNTTTNGTQPQPQPDPSRSRTPNPADPTPTAPPDQPSTSVLDPGTAPRPRDIRTLHLQLAAMGVPAYQDRVPLQLLDYAYRYTSSVLSDAHNLVAEGFVTNASTGTGPAPKGRGAHEKEGTVSLAAVKLAAAAARPGAGAGGAGPGALPKETMTELAQERNKTRLPDVEREGLRFGVRLPHERFLVSGVGWKFDEETEVVEDARNGAGRLDEGFAEAERDGDGDQEMRDGDGEEDDGEDGGYEDVFGREEGGSA